MTFSVENLEYRVCDGGLCFFLTSSSVTEDDAAFIKANILHQATGAKKKISVFLGAFRVQFYERRLSDIVSDHSIK